MAVISSITFPNNDTVGRKAMSHAADAILHAMKAGKRTGDHILVTMDDGTTQQYTLGAHSIAWDGAIKKHMKGIDCAFSLTAYASRLPDLGLGFACRYYGGSAAKDLTPGEAKALSDNGI